MATQIASITSALVTQGFPPPSPHFINNILSNQRGSAPPPLPALVATAKHRLLSADFTQPNVLDTAAVVSFPPDLSNPAIAEARLPGSIPVQVTGIEDLTKSKWEQIEAIEAFERGEMVRGREVIRVVPEDTANESGGGGGGGTQSGGPATASSLSEVISGSGGGGTGATSKDGSHRLVLQDVKGQKMYGIELKSVPDVGLVMNIGSKIMLKNVVVARGMIMLEPSTTKVLGGKIEVLHKAWLDGRKKELMDALGTVSI